MTRGYFKALLLGIGLALPSVAFAWGPSSTPNYCAHAFLPAGSQETIVVRSRVNSEVISNFVSAKMTGDETEPLRAYAHETAERLSRRLSLHERLLIANRILESADGFLGAFGNRMATLTAGESKLQPLQGKPQISGTAKLVEHPKYGKLRPTGFGDFSIRLFVERTRELHSSLRANIERKKKEKSHSQAHFLRNAIAGEQTRLIEGHANLGLKFYSLWKFNIRNTVGGGLGDNFEMLFDESNPREDLTDWRSGYFPMTVLRGVVPKLRVPQATLEQSYKFLNWLEEKPAREQYAQLLVTLVSERIADVIASRNQGRLFNHGEAMTNPYRAPGLIKKTFSKVKALGSDKGARSFMDETAFAIRSETKALGDDLLESFIYPAQVAFHRAPVKSALYLLWLDPNFESFKEAADLHLKAAVLLKESLVKQSIRAQTLRSKVARALEEGKVDWALQQNCLLALQDFGHTQDLFSEVNANLERFAEFTHATINDKQFVGEDTRTRFLEYRPKIDSTLADFKQAVTADFKELSDSIKQLSSVEREIDSYGRSGLPPGTLAALARRLW